MQTTLFQPQKQKKEKHSYYIPAFVGFYTVAGPLKEDDEEKE